MAILYNSVFALSGSLSYVCTRGEHGQEGISTFSGVSPTLPLLPCWPVKVSGPGEHSPPSLAPLHSLSGTESCCSSGRTCLQHKTCTKRKEGERSHQSIKVSLMWGFKKAKLPDNKRFSLTTVSQHCPFNSSVGIMVGDDAAAGLSVCVYAYVYLQRLILFTWT